MKAKQFLAVAMSATMLFGSSMAAFASDDTSITGSGDMEGWVNKKVITLDVPTDAASKLAFHIDPQELAAATEGKRYDDAKIADGATVLFKTKDAVAADAEKSIEAAPAEYGATSQAIKIANHSAIDVDLTIKVKVTDATGITLKDSSTFTGTGADLYLAVAGKATKDTSNETKALTTEDQKIEKTLAAAEDAFDTGYEADKGYTFTLKEDLSGATIEDYTFTVTGAANKDGDWSALKTAAPKLSIVYSAVEHGTATEEENTPAQTATEAYVLDYEGTVYLKKTSNSNFEADAEVGDVTVNGTKIDGAVMNASGALVIGAKSGLSANSDGEYVIVATIGGVTYTATLK